MPNLLPPIQEAFSVLGLLLSFIGLFLSIWIIIPAPIYLLLPLGVGAPEVCHWLLLLNTTAFALSFFRLRGNLLQYVTLSISIVGIILSITPLLQIPTTQQQMQSAMEKQLGKDYLKPILEQKHFGRSPILGLRRSHPFNVIDAFKGIHIDDVRYTPNIEFASPDGISLRLNICLLYTSPG